MMTEVKKKIALKHHHSRFLHAYVLHHGLPPTFLYQSLQLPTSKVVSGPHTRTDGFLSEGGRVDIKRTRQSFTRMSQWWLATSSDICLMLSASQAAEAFRRGQATGTSLPVVFCPFETDPLTENLSVFIFWTLCRLVPLVF